RSERDVELGKGREPEAGVLVAGIELVEQELEAEQPLVDVLRRVPDAMIVVPERALGLEDALARVGIGVVEPGLLHGAEVVVVLPPEEEPAGTAVAVGPVVEVVEVGRGLGYP